MMIDETAFHGAADKTLAHLGATLEPFDQNGTLEVEYQAGVMTIALENGKQFLISKHAPTRQLWLSSPVSGGWHFSYNPPPLEGGVRGGVLSTNTTGADGVPPTLTLPLEGGGNNWQLADGRTLIEVLTQELRALKVPL